MRVYIGNVVMYTWYNMTSTYAKNTIIHFAHYTEKGETSHSMTQ